MVYVQGTCKFTGFPRQGHCWWHEQGAMKGFSKQSKAGGYAVSVTIIMMQSLKKILKKEKPTLPMKIGKYKFSYIKI